MEPVSGTLIITPTFLKAMALAASFSARSPKYSEVDKLEWEWRGRGRIELVDDWLTVEAERTGESAVAEKISDLLRGLCCNCENNEICVIPKSEGGVWHCEEYR